MIAVISPGALCGQIEAIPSKSQAHRLIILAALADKPTRLIMRGGSEDIDATIGCVRALGADVCRDEAGITVVPGGVSPKPALNCFESGSTLRFLLPVAAALGCDACFTGSGRLPKRPIGELMAALIGGGVRFSAEALPFTVSGKLQPGEFSLPGNISSQYITGLLLALPMLGGNSSIRLTTPLQSAPYVDMTVDALKLFGVSVTKKEKGWDIPGGQTFISPGTVTVEGDWSNGAIFLTAGAIGGNVALTGLNLDSAQGDKAIVGALKQLGAGVSLGREISISHRALKALNLDVSGTPDLLPALAAAAAFADGTSVFTGVSRLSLKESDRVSAVCRAINSLGGKAVQGSDFLEVYGTGLVGGTVCGAGDHRIVMAAAIAGTMCEYPVTITDAEAVNKSYPGFFWDFVKLGGKANVN